MSWIFITVILSVVTGGCCKDTSVCDRWQTPSVTAADDAVLGCGETQSSSAQLILNQSAWLTDSSINFENSVQPDFVLRPRSQIFRDHFSGTSPPLV